MAAENKDFSFGVDESAVGHWGRGADFAFRVLLLLAWTFGVVWGLVPGPGVRLENENVVKTEFGGVLTAENDHLVVLDGACAVVCTGIGRLALLVDEFPGAGLGGELEHVGLVGWADLE